MAAPLLSEEHGAENSFDPGLSEWDCILQELHQIAVTLQQRLENHPVGRALTLKVKYADYQQITRSRTLPCCIDSLDSIIGLATELLRSIDHQQKPIRLLGLTLSNLIDEADRFEQLSLNFAVVQTAEE